jgi:hypothetical protein
MLVGVHLITIENTGHGVWDPLEKIEEERRIEILIQDRGHSPNDLSKGRT